VAGLGYLEVFVMARVMVAEYRGFEDKNGKMDDGTAWAHRRLNLEEESGRATFVKIPENRVGDFALPNKGDLVAYVVDHYDRVQRQLDNPAAIARAIGLQAAAAV
jgi:hypothetical protein